MIIRLLQIEWIKLWNYRTFKFITGGYVILILLIFLTFSELSFGPFRVLSQESFKFPYVWQNVAFLSRFLNLYLAIAVIFIISNEFSYRTLRQNIIDGLTRKQVVLSKLWVVFLISVAATIVIASISVFLGVINSTTFSSAVVTARLDFVAGFFVNAFGLFSLAALLSYLFKRNGLTILIFLPYVIFIENILRNLIDAPFVKYFPVKVFSSLIQYPHAALSENAIENLGFFQNSVPIDMMVVGIAYGLLFHFLAYQFIKSRDL